MYVSPGSMGVMMKAVMMVKFQAGLDASTLADRFNFEAYPQIVRHFGMEDYEAWDLGMCPVPVRLVRVKTGMAYTTFIDRDAVSHLQDYLRWRGFREGKKYDPSGPLFVTRRGTPVSPGWVSFRFSKAAIDAGIQKWVSNLVYKIHPHEVRDLLKSTLMVSGCAQYAADHVLGHAPRDSYEKQAVLYPEALCAAYSKASRSLNIFSGIEKHLRAAGVDSGEQAASGGYGYQKIEEQQQDAGGVPEDGRRRVRRAQDRGLRQGLESGCRARRRGARVHGSGRRRGGRVGSPGTGRGRNLLDSSR